MNEQPKPGGLRSPKGGRPPKAVKSRRRLITLPPELDDRLIEWSVNTGGKISTLLSELAEEFLRNSDY